MVTARGPLTVTARTCKPPIWTAVRWLRIMVQACPIWAFCASRGLGGASAGDRRGLCCPVGEGAGDGGGAAGYSEPGVDVLQVLADGFLGHSEPPGDLGVGVADGDQAQQFPMSGGELEAGAAAAFGVEVGLVQVGAQQGQQVAVA